MWSVMQTAVLYEEIFLENSENETFVSDRQAAAASTAWIGSDNIPYIGHYRLLYLHV